MRHFPDNIKKIAILRANALGDFIVTLPAIEALRNTYPHAEIILLGKPWHKQFLEQEESGLKRTPIDRVVILPIIKGIREEPSKKENKNEIKDFILEIQKENIDIALNFHGKGIAANPFINKINAKYTVGNICKEAEPLDKSLEYFYYQPEVIRYLEIARLVNAETTILEPYIQIFNKDKNEALSLLNSHQIKKYIVIHPSGTDIRRMWDTNKFAKLADELYHKGYDIVFTGSMSDEDYNTTIINKMNCSAYNIAGMLSLGGLAGLMSLSSLAISVDTGPLHLARAAGAKTIGLYWGPNLINWGPLSRINHRPIVSWNIPCPKCGVSPINPFPFEPKSPTCDHNCSFIDSITVDEVLNEANILLTNNSQ
jgi:ADP-heptose:LPS heptosyltransferase